MLTQIFALDQDKIFKWDNEGSDQTVPTIHIRNINQYMFKYQFLFLKQFDIKFLTNLSYEQNELLSVVEKYLCSNFGPKSVSMHSYLEGLTIVYSLESYLFELIQMQTKIEANKIWIKDFLMNYRKMWRHLKEQLFNYITIEMINTQFKKNILIQIIYKYFQDSEILFDSISLLQYFYLHLNTQYDDSSSQFSYFIQNLGQFNDPQEVHFVQILIQCYMQISNIKNTLRVTDNLVIKIENVDLLINQLMQTSNTFCDQVKLIQKDYIYIYFSNSQNSNNSSLDSNPMKNLVIQFDDVTIQLLQIHEFCYQQKKKVKQENLSQLCQKFLAEQQINVDQNSLEFLNFLFFFNLFQKNQTDKQILYHVLIMFSLSRSKYCFENYRIFLAINYYSLKPQQIFYKDFVFVLRSIKKINSSSVYNQKYTNIQNQLLQTEKGNSFCNSFKIDEEQLQFLELKFIENLKNFFNDEYWNQLMEVEEIRDHAIFTIGFVKKTLIHLSNSSKEFEKVLRPLLCLIQQLHIQLVTQHNKSDTCFIILIDEMLTQYLNEFENDKNQQKYLLYKDKVWKIVQNYLLDILNMQNYQFNQQLELLTMTNFERIFVQKVVKLEKRREIIDNIILNFIQSNAKASAKASQFIEYLPISDVKKKAKAVEKIFSLIQQNQFQFANPNFSEFFWLVGVQKHNRDRLLHRTRTPNSEQKTAISFLLVIYPLMYKTYKKFPDYQDFIKIDEFQNISSFNQMICYEQQQINLYQSQDKLKTNCHQNVVQLICKEKHLMFIDYFIKQSHIYFKGIQDELNWIQTMLPLNTTSIDIELLAYTFKKSNGQINEEIVISQISEQLYVLEQSEKSFFQEAIMCKTNLLTTIKNNVLLQNQISMIHYLLSLMLQNNSKQVDVLISKLKLQSLYLPHIIIKEIETRIQKCEKDILFRNYDSISKKLIKYYQNFLSPVIFLNSLLLQLQSYNSILYYCVKLYKFNYNDVNLSDTITNELGQIIYLSFCIQNYEDDVVLLQIVDKLIVIYQKMDLLPRRQLITSKNFTKKLVFKCLKKIIQLVYTKINVTKIQLQVQDKQKLICNFIELVLGTNTKVQFIEYMDSISFLENSEDTYQLKMAVFKQIIISLYNNYMILSYEMMKGLKSLILQIIEYGNQRKKDQIPIPSQEEKKNSNQNKINILIYQLIQTIFQFLNYNSNSLQNLFTFNQENIINLEMKDSELLQTLSSQLFDSRYNNVNSDKMLTLIPLLLEILKQQKSQVNLKNNPILDIIQLDFLIQQGMAKTQMLFQKIKYNMISPEDFGKFQDFKIILQLCYLMEQGFAINNKSVAEEKLKLLEKNIGLIKSYLMVRQFYITKNFQNKIKLIDNKIWFSLQQDNLALHIVQDCRSKPISEDLLQDLNYIQNYLENQDSSLDAKVLEETHLQINKILFWAYKNLNYNNAQLLFILSPKFNKQEKVSLLDIFYTFTAQYGQQINKIESFIKSYFQIQEQTDPQQQTTNHSYFSSFLKSASSTKDTVQSSFSCQQASSTSFSSAANQLPEFKQQQIFTLKENFQLNSIDLFSDMQQAIMKKYLITSIKKFKNSQQILNFISNFPLSLQYIWISSEFKNGFAQFCVDNFDQQFIINIMEQYLAYSCKLQPEMNYCEILLQKITAKLRKIKKFRFTDKQSNFLVKLSSSHSISVQCLTDIINDLYIQIFRQDQGNDKYIDQLKSILEKFLHNLLSLVFLHTYNKEYTDITHYNGLMQIYNSHFFSFFQQSNHPEQNMEIKKEENDQLFSFNKIEEEKQYMQDKIITVKVNKQNHSLEIETINNDVDEKQIKDNDKIIQQPVTIDKADASYNSIYEKYQSQIYESLDTLINNQSIDYDFSSINVEEGKIEPEYSYPELSDSEFMDLYFNYSSISPSDYVSDDDSSQQYNVQDKAIAECYQKIMEYREQLAMLKKYDLESQKLREDIQKQFQQYIQKNINLITEYEQKNKYFKQKQSFYVLPIYLSQDEDIIQLMPKQYQQSFETNDNKNKGNMQQQIDKETKSQKRIIQRYIYEQTLQQQQCQTTSIQKQEVSAQQKNVLQSQNSEVYQCIFNAKRKVMHSKGNENQLEDEFFQRNQKTQMKSQIQHMNLQNGSCLDLEQQQSIKQNSVIAFQPNIFLSIPKIPQIENNPHFKFNIDRLLTIDENLMKYICLNPYNCLQIHQILIYQLYKYFFNINQCSQSQQELQEFLKQGKLIKNTLKAITNLWKQHLGIPLILDPNYPFLQDQTLNSVNCQINNGKVTKQQKTYKCNFSQYSIMMNSNNKIFLEMLKYLIKFSFMHYVYIMNCVDREILEFLTQYFSMLEFQQRIDQKEFFNQFTIFFGKKILMLYNIRMLDNIGDQLINIKIENFSTNQTQIFMILQILPFEISLKIVNNLVNSFMSLCNPELQVIQKFLKETGNFQNIKKIEQQKDLIIKYHNTLSQLLESFKKCIIEKEKEVLQNTKLMQKQYQNHQNASQYIQQMNKNLEQNVNSFTLQKYRILTQQILIKNKSEFSKYLSQLMDLCEQFALNILSFFDLELISVLSLNIINLIQLVYSFTLQEELDTNNQSCYDFKELKKGLKKQKIDKITLCDTYQIAFSDNDMEIEQKQQSSDNVLIQHKQMNNISKFIEHYKNFIKNKNLVNMLENAIQQMIFSNKIIISTNNCNFFMQCNINCSTIPIEKKIKILNKFLHLDLNSETMYLNIDRQNAWISSLQQILAKNKLFKLKQSKIKISFINESGIDGGGLLREWYMLIFKDILDEQKGLWICQNNQQIVYPSPYSNIVPNNILYFKMLGQLVAKAILDIGVCGIHFPKNLLKMILGKPIELSDLQQLDLELSNNLSGILDYPDNDIEQLNLDFTYMREFFGKNQIIQLIQNGDKIKLNNKNKEDYVIYYTIQKLMKETFQQQASFVQGFYEIIPKQYLFMFDVTSLDQLIAGHDKINVNSDLKINTIYSQYTENCNQIKWFWSIINEYSQQNLFKLIFFWTGYMRLPYQGFSQNKLQLRKKYGSTESLIISHTCSLILDVPEYSSLEILKQKLEMSIQLGCEGFFLT